MPPAFGTNRTSGSTRSSTTIRNVATGPRNSEANHHARPLRFFDWASPALIRESVPQPTAELADWEEARTTVSIGGIAGTPSAVVGFIPTYGEIRGWRA